MAKDRYERKHRKTVRNPEAMATMAGANFDAVPPLAEAMGLAAPEDSYLQMTSDRDGETETVVLVPAGTTVKYRGHVSGGMVRVLLPDGAEAVMHPHCFSVLR